MIYVAPNVSYPVYFGRKEEPTDERGVFDVARAGSLCKGVGPDRDSLNGKVLRNLKLLVHEVNKYVKLPQSRIIQRRRKSSRQYIPQLTSRKCLLIETE